MQEWENKHFLTGKSDAFNRENASPMCFPIQVSYCVVWLTINRGQRKVRVEIPLNLMTVITRDCNCIDLSLALFFSSSPSLSPSLPPGSFEGPDSCQGCHSRQPSPSTAPAVAMAMDGTALLGLCEGAEGASGRMNAAASFPNLGQPYRAGVSDGRG